MVRRARYPSAPPIVGEPRPAFIDPQAAGVESRLNTLAIWSLVFGCFVFAGIVSVFLGAVAVGLGLFARQQIHASLGMQRGAGLAVVGAVAGSLNVVLNVFLLILLAV